MPSLTGIRGIAALWVFLFHFPPTHQLPVFANGYLGVDFFFILSGFILTHAHCRTLSLNRSSILSFFRNRVTRIFPLHLVALSAVIATVWLVPDFTQSFAPDFFNWHDLPYHIFLVQGWTQFSAGWNGPAWSLSAEWLAYLLFPFMLLSIKKLDIRLVQIFMYILLGAAILFYETTSIEQMSHAGKTGVLRMAVGFTVGMLAYRVFQTQKINLHPIFVVVPIFLCTLVTVIQPAILCFFTLAILLCAQGNNILASSLGCKAIVFLGEVSFSFYILQWLIIEWGKYVTQHIGYSVPVYTAVVVMTWITTLAAYKYIETPMRMWGRPRKIEN